MSTEDPSAEPWLRRVAAIPEADAIGREALLPGEVLSDRFEIVSLAGRGGMGAVYRAIDRESRQPVAIKVVSAADGDSDERFVREARLLSELTHPCIVRYHAQGTTRRGQLYFVMEWLEGEDLAARLARSKLEVDESLALVRRVAQGLALAHARGVVHRDIKPSNIFLPDREIRASKLIDFGVARRLAETASLMTQTGAVLGTIGYMSPEQAMGSREVDARTDVFALGCVLYECLTGQPAFNGVNPVAALAKVLYEDPPRARESLPDLRAGVDELLARMLEKRPEHRLRDAAELVNALDELEREALLPPRAAPISANERAMAAVVLGQSPQHAAPRELDLAAIRALAAEFGAEPIALRGGGLAVVLSGARAATDLAERAVRLALRLYQLRPELSYAVATGRTEDPSDRTPTGAAIDRAAQLLAADVREPAGVAIDALTVGLIGSSFELREGEGVTLVVAERPSVESARSLMGKPTPFLGRDKELALLEATLRECIDDSIAHAVLVSGAPGQGKSRLRQEFVRASVRSRADLRVLLVRTDPLGARSSLLLIRRLLRAALPLSEGDDYPALFARVAELEHAERLAGFLGELLGTPCPAPVPAELRAARDEPQIMSLWLRRSFMQWFTAFASKGPALIALEDLQWADSASVAFLNDALRAVSDRPLLVLALARSEVHELFPHVFSGTALQSLGLGRLTPRAAERLVESVLGPTDVATLARVVEQADGNAFYLEELMRGIARGDSARVPESVLALVQSRLESLAPAQRQVLRAASVFGEVCWDGGVRALLDSSLDGELELQLRALVELEVLTPVLGSRFADQEEFRFRHSLIREAAYGMLPERDRVDGNALAADWLERNGERDATTLANHYELGDVSESAMRWLLRAARAALNAGNGDEAMRCAARAQPRSANDLDRGRLETIRMSAFVLRAEWAEAVEAAELATALLPVESNGWFFAHCGALLAGTFLGSERVVAKSVTAVMGATARLGAATLYGHALFMATQGLSFIDKLDVGVGLVRRVEQLLEGEPGADPLLAMWLDCTRSLIESRQGQLGIALDRISSALVLAEQLGASMARGMAASNLVTVLSETGHVARTLEAARTARAICESVGMQVNHDHIDWSVAASSAHADEHAPGITELRAPVYAILEKQDSSARSASARTWVAYFDLDRGDLDSAERGATQAFDEAHFAYGRGDALGVLALVALCRGRPELALTHVERGLAETSTGASPHTASVLRLVRARALHALDRHPEAAEAIRLARDRVLDCAQTLKDPELRATFLYRAPNEATLRLAIDWASERCSIYG